MTDIEGSTRLWEREPDAMAEALAAHDRLLRDVVETGGGRVVKTTGDGLLATFPSATTGLASAISGQHRLGEWSWPTTVPLRVRMAVHVGEARIRDDDVFGPAVNRVARLLSIGHGGQILLSGVAADLSRDMHRDGVTLLDLGVHRLKDLTGVEHVFQPSVAGLADTFPALRSLRDERTNLPAQLTSFIGRDAELAEVAARFRTARLVSLVGTGGTGKTRLALQFAAEAVDRYRDGAWLVELAPVADPAVVVPAVAEALNVRERPGQALEATLVEELRDRALLLILDNCEHLVAQASALADRILRSSRDVAILATSREALGIAGESVYQVPSLGLPPEPGQAPGGWRRGSGPTATPALSGGAAGQPDGRSGAAASEIEAIAGAAAVRLFVERATAAEPTFALDPATAPAVAQICRRLDGIPLAIELAAARVALLSPAEIATRLADRFRLLTGGSRTALPRQQTLQALVDWSWELLDETERCLFRRLAVFAGGWTLEAAESVATDSPMGGRPGTGPAHPVPDLDVLTGLDHLVRKSLVTVDRGAGGTRYRFLETIRQYARDRLIASGEADMVRARHLAWCRGVMAEAEPMIRDHRMIPALERIDPDRDNLRVAFEWGLEADPEAAADLVALSAGYLRMRSISSEGFEASLAAAEAVRALPADPAATERRRRLVVRALAAAVYAAIGGGTAWRTPPIIAEIRGLVSDADDPEIRMYALMSMCIAAFWTGNVELGMPASLELAQVATERREPWFLGMAYATQATLEAFAHELEAAERTSRLAVEAAARSENVFFIGNAALVRGRICGRLGLAVEARRCFALAVEILVQIGDTGFILLVRSDYAHALRRVGDLDGAEAIYRETLPGWNRTGNRGAVAHQLESIASVLAAHATPDDRRAATLIAAADDLRRASGAERLPDEQEDVDATLDAIRGRIGLEATDAALARGRTMSVDAAIELAVGEPADGSAE